MINDFKEDSNQQLNEIRKSTEDLDKKFINVDEKFNKEMLIVEKPKQIVVL
jgi:hypothetical protein